MSGSKVSKPLSSKSFSSERRDGEGEDDARHFVRQFQGVPGRASKSADWLYNVRIFRDKTLGVQVIAIGNLTVGGTGKTPVVEKFARELRDAGRTVAILSRGYRSKPQPLQPSCLLNKILLREDQTPPRVVSDGKSLLLDSEMAGDEPYMLASNLKDVVVLVDKDRVKSGRYAIEKFGCDTLLLDDGFQYWDLRGRRQDVVLIDRQQPFGNEHLLPRGTLREPPSHLARAQTIFITKSDGKTAELRERIAEFNPDRRPSSNASISRFISRTFSPANARAWIFCTGTKVASLSGIAQPESFEQSLVKLGARTGLFQALRRPSPLHPAGNPQRHQPRQETPGRASSSPRKRTPCASPKLTGATCRFISCAWKSKSSAARTTFRIASAKSVSAENGHAALLVRPRASWR